MRPVSFAQVPIWKHLVTHISDSLVLFKDTMQTRMHQMVSMAMDPIDLTHPSQSTSLSIIPVVTTQMRTASLSRALHSEPAVTSAATSPAKHRRLIFLTHCQSVGHPFASVVMDPIGFCAITQSSHSVFHEHYDDRPTSGYID